MRHFLGCVLLIVGAGLCVLEMLSLAKLNAQSEQNFQFQLEKIPVKAAYSQAEIMDVAWQVWTNQIHLPSQNTYSVEELKAALVKTLPVRADQETYDRTTLRRVIETICKRNKWISSSLATVGVPFMLVGAFLLGTCFGVKPSSR